MLNATKGKRLNAFKGYVPTTAPNRHSMHPVDNTREGILVQDAFVAPDWQSLLTSISMPWKNLGKLDSFDVRTTFDSKMASFV